MFKLDSLLLKQQKAVDGLVKIWSDMGLTSVESQQRFNVFCTHIENSCNRMLRDEDKLLSDICADILKLKDSLRTLSDQLRVPPPEVAEAAGKIDLLRHLEEEFEKLDELRKSRLAKLLELREEERQLSRRLKKPFVGGDDSTVPSSEFLDGLQSTIDGLKEEKAARERAALEMKTEIEQLLADLEAEPSGETGLTLIKGDIDSMLLSTENMNSITQYLNELKSLSQENLKTADQLRERLNQLCRMTEVPEIEQHELLAKHNGSQPSTLVSLRKEIERLEELRRHNIEKYIHRARAELKHWWEICYFSELEQQEFLPFYSTNYTETLLTEHEDETARLKKYFGEYSDLFAKVDKRENLWGQFLEFERASTDPTRFKSRHYNLIMEEKERKRFQTLLPKLEKELFEIVRDLEESTGRMFTIGGLSFKEHIETQWTTYNEQKELEKKHRQIKKEILTKEEMLFGSKPSTPLSLQKTRKRLHDMISTPNSSTRKKAREEIQPPSSENRLASSMQSSSASCRDTSKRTNSKRRDLQGLFSDMKNLPLTSSSVSCKDGSSGLASYSEFKFSFNAKNLEKLYNRSTPMPSILEGTTSVDQENMLSAPIGLDNFCTKIFNS